MSSSISFSSSSPSQPRLELGSLGARSIQVLDTSSIRSMDSCSDQGTRSSDSIESNTIKASILIGTRYNDYESSAYYREGVRWQRIIITSGVTGLIVVIGCVVGVFFYKTFSS